MKLFIKYYGIISLCMLPALHGHAQLLGASTRAYSNMLNGVSKTQARNDLLVNISNPPAPAIAAPKNSFAVQNTFAPVVAVLLAGQDVSIQYGVPALVLADRWLFGAALRNKLADLLEWQNFYANFGGMSADDRQRMVNIFQQDIDKMQWLYDNLVYSCPYVNFNDYNTRVNADVRYNDPITGSLQLLRSDNGVADFNNVSYEAVEGNPVKATVQIYKK